MKTKDKNKNNLLPGLREAFRLLSLNDLDFGPGRILARIKQLEGKAQTPKPEAYSAMKETGDVDADMRRAFGELASMMMRVRDMLGGGCHVALAATQQSTDPTKDELRLYISSDPGDPGYARLLDALQNRPKAGATILAKAPGQSSQRGN
jgi:hypothetical protein